MTRGILSRAAHRAPHRAALRVSILGAALASAMASLALSSSASAQGGPPNEAQRDPRNRGGGTCTANAYNCVDAVNPLPAPNTVWMEEMTWMDVRDAMKAGKTTAIIATGGMEPNGPWLVTGKHNYVLHANCEAIARKLGNALCAPIVKFVPEGNIDPASGHMASPGTISMREETFRMLLTDLVHSLKAHGFTKIILIGDSGGNQAGQRWVADSVTKLWNGSPIVAHIQEYYDYASVAKYMEQFGVNQTVAEGLHDDPEISLNMFIDDPKSIRYDERAKAKLLTINGVSLADRKKATAWAKQIVAFRVTVTTEAIEKAIANKGTLPAPPRRTGGS